MSERLRSIPDQTPENPLRKVVDGPVTVVLFEPDQDGVMKRDKGVYDPNSYAYKPIVGASIDNPVFSSEAGQLAKARESRPVRIIDNTVPPHILAERRAEHRAEREALEAGYSRFPNAPQTDLRRPPRFPSPPEPI